MNQPPAPDPAPAAPLGRAAAIYVAAELGARLAWFGLVLGLGCLLSQRDFGAWSLLMALVGLLEIGLTLGLHGPAIRWTYDHSEQRYRRVLFTLLITWLAITLPLLLGLDRLGLLGFHRLVDQLGWASHGRVALGLAWAGAASAIPLAFLAARQRAGGYAGLRIATVLAPTAGVLVVLALGQRSTASVLTGQLLAALPVALVALALGFRASTPVFLRSELRPLLAFALPVAPHMLAQWVLSWSDRWLLERLMDLEAVATYHMAYLPGLGMLLLGGALNRAWYPLLFRELEGVDRAEAQGGEPAFSSAGSGLLAATTEEGRAGWERCRRQARAFVLLLVAVGAGVALWGGELLRWLPLQGYEGSPGLVALVVLGTTAASLYLPAMNQLYHHRHTGPIPWLTGLAAALNLGLNLLLIPRIGVLGAALATALAYLVLAALFHAAAARVSRPLLAFRETLSLAAPSALVLLGACALGALPLGHGWRVGLELLGTGLVIWAAVRSGALGELRGLLRAR
jgi:O-antigen/teichoic acid export membrane protein